MTECKCDKCSTAFKIELETTRLENDVERTYFTCPECDAEYDVWFKNDEVYELEKERDTWKDRIQNPHMRKKAKKEVERIQSRIAEIMKRLKCEYVRGINRDE